MNCDQVTHTFIARGDYEQLRGHHLMLSVLGDEQVAASTVWGVHQGSWAQILEDATHYARQKNTIDRIQVSGADHCFRVGHQQRHHPQEA